MANTIALAKNYVELLDEVYKRAATSADLISGADMVRAGANAKEILIPKISMDGLKDYSRATGYISGDVNLAWETKSFNYDRGVKFMVDTMDNEETMGLAFGRLASEFVRTNVAPEDDAFTYSTICGTANIQKVAAGATLATGANVLAALVVGVTALEEAEVNIESCVLKITPTLYNLAKNVALTDNQGILDRFSSVITVPQSRFYTAIDLKDGTTEGELTGGFAKASAGKDINFLIIDKNSIIKYNKHTASDIIAPSINTTADAYIQKYRKYSIVSVFDNKVNGVYLHHKA